MSCGPSMKTVLTILMVAMKNVTEISGGGQFFFSHRSLGMSTHVLKHNPLHD